MVLLFSGLEQMLAKVLLDGIGVPLLDAHLVKVFLAAVQLEDGLGAAHVL